MNLLMDDDFGILLAAEKLRRESTACAPIFSLKTYEESRCKADFRFFKDDINRLQKALKIPNMMTAKQGTVFKGSEGLCLLLRRLAYPNRLLDLQFIFGRSVQDLGNIFNTVLDFIYDNYRTLLTDVNQWWMSLDNLKTYSVVIKNKGSPLDGCFGFIDGTIHRTCRPRKNQKEVYSGHKRTHGLKYQSTILPNGLIANLHGPEPGRRHDAFMLKQSNLLQSLGRIIGNERLYLYGDSGYPLKKYLITPNIGSNLTAEQQSFNVEMSKVRIAVEWEFGELFEQFAFINYKYNQKIYLQPVGKYVIVSAILKNCQACLYGCQTSKYFNLEAPKLEQYLHNDPNL